MLVQVIHASYTMIGAMHARCLVVTSLCQWSLTSILTAMMLQALMDRQTEVLPLQPVRRLHRQSRSSPCSNDLNFRSASNLSKQQQSWKPPTRLFREQREAMYTRLDKTPCRQLAHSPTESQMMLLTIPPNSLAPTDGGFVCDCRPCTSLRKTRNSVMEVASFRRDSPSSNTRKW